MKIYCPNCYYPNEKGRKYCEKCGSEVLWEDCSYKFKLIKALKHKRMDIVVNAAKILSNFRDRETENALISLIKESRDPYVQSEAINSLAKIGTERSLEVLNQISTSGSVIPRLRALEAIKSIRERTKIRAG